MGDIFCGLSARPDLWAFCNGYVAGAGNTTCGALLTCIIFYQASHCELLLVVGVLLDFRHERTLKRRLAGKPYNFSGLLQGANEWGWREEIGPKQCLLSQFRLVRGKSGGRQKREGDFSCEISPSLPIFRDPVRVPDHNDCYPRIARHPRATARTFTSLFRDYTRHKSFPSAILLQLPGPSLVADSRR